MVRTRDQDDLDDAKRRYLEAEADIERLRTKVALLEGNTPIFSGPHK